MQSEIIYRKIEAKIRRKETRKVILRNKREDRHQMRIFINGK